MAAPRSHTAADIFYGRSSSTSTSSFPSQPPSAPGISSVSLSLRGIGVALCGPRGASSRHCATYTTGQPPLHAATSYLHEKGVASSFSTPLPASSRPRTMPDEAPLEAPSSVNTVHHYRRGSLYFKEHGARLFTLVPRHFGHDPPPPPPPPSIILLFIRPAPGMVRSCRD